MKDNSKAGTATQERTRYTELKRMLEERRREIQAEVQGKMRDVRAEGTWGGKQNEVFDAVESSEADIQDDIEFALIQMKSETLNKINDALIAARAGRLRQLLRLRRGNRREAAAGAALRGPLQGLRGSARGSRAARAAAGRPARHVVAVPRHVTAGVPNQSTGSAGGGARHSRHRRPSMTISSRSERRGRHERSTRRPQARGPDGDRASRLDSVGAADSAAAGHGAVSQFVHAARRGARELGAPDRRCHRATAS